jgi:beta-galactosidase
VRRRLAGLVVLLALIGAFAGTAAGAGRFPRGFRWGVAVAPFQTEMGGRPEHRDTGTDWWAWVHDSANQAGGRVTRDRPERGPGSWRRYRADHRLARRLHLGAYRLGIEWSRIFPRSTARAHTLRQLDRLADHGALRHYRAVLRDLRARRLEPFVTLNHFTLPRWIHDPIAARVALARVAPDAPLPRWKEPKGWLEARTVREFGKYAAYLGWKLGPLVRYWTPINEPLVVVSSGYFNVPGVVAGNFPPGAFTFTGAVRAVRNLVAANRAAYDALHRRDRDAHVGLVQNLVAFTPADPASAADRRGVRDADWVFNRLFLEAAIRGREDVNADGRIEPGERFPSHAGRADFVGVNYYFRGRVRGSARLSERAPVIDFLPTTSYRSPADPGGPPCPTVCSDLGSELYPAGFRRVLRLAGSYRRPVYVTENGIADANDDMRRAFLREHLEQMRRSIRAHEADVRGYFEWSLMDNFEWAEGYGPKFGLATIDRRPRASARFYARVARTNALP